MKVRCIKEFNSWITIGLIYDINKKIGGFYSLTDDGGYDGLLHNSLFITLKEHRLNILKSL